MNKTDFSKTVQDIATEARTKLINLIADVCRQNGGEIKFKYYSCIVDDIDGETVETDICGAKVYDDGDLVFVTDNGDDEEDAIKCSMNELYNICLKIAENEY